MENHDNNEVQKQDVDETSLIALLLAFFLPPLGVAIKCGFGASLIINIILTFFWIPGVIHALFVILRK